MAMVDIKSRVAARRAELAEAEERASEEAARRAQARAAMERVAREEALEAIAADLSASGVPVVRAGDELHVEEPSPSFDVEGLRRSKLTRLLKQEARRLWTPGDNWFVISCIVAGVCTLPLNGLGVALIVIGFWRRHVLNAKFRSVVRNRYPQAFASL